MIEKNKIYSKKVIEIADFIYKYPDKKISVAVSVFCKKFQKTERTIWSYVTEAQKYNKERLIREESKREKAQDDAKIKSLKSAILTRNESLETLSNIAKGNARKVSEEVIIPTDGDRIRAIQQLSKMQGWETEKIDVTTKGDAINTAVKVTIVEKKV